MQSSLILYFTFINHFVTFQKEGCFFVVVISAAISGVYVRALVCQCVCVVLLVIIDIEVCWFQ